MVRKATVHFIFCLLLLGGSPLYAQNRYSQAAEIDDSEFLSTVKEVSLDLRSDDSLAQYISLAAQRNEIVSALAGYGIAVRPNAPVTLDGYGDRPPSRGRVQECQDQRGRGNNRCPRNLYQFAVFCESRGPPEWKTSSGVGRSRDFLFGE